MVIMIKQKLGKIKQVDLKDVFEKEDKDFTPWLNENLNILGEKLNIDIIDSNVEENVGNFSCDITARDSDSNKTEQQKNEEEQRISRFFKNKEKIHYTDLSFEEFAKRGVENV